MPTLPTIAWADVLSAAATLFFIMDPLGNVPIFQSILQPFPTRRRTRIIARELIFALIVLLTFLLVGNRVLDFLGLGQPSLSISGGVLLFIIALRMVFPGRRGGMDEEVESDPFIVPLAIPLIAGPSTIALLLLLGSQQPGLLLEWVLALLLAWSLVTIILVASPYITRFLGPRGLRAVERLMGMLLISGRGADAAGRGGNLRAQFGGLDRTGSICVAHAGILLGQRWNCFAAVIYHHIVAALIVHTVCKIWLSSSTGSGSPRRRGIRRSREWVRGRVKQVKGRVGPLPARG